MNKYEDTTASTDCISSSAIYAVSYFTNQWRQKHTVKKNAENLVAAAKEIGLEVNADKTKYMVVSRDQRAERNHSVKIDSNSFDGVEEFKYLGTTLTNQNCIQVGSQEQIEVGECLLLFGAEAFVLPFVIQKLKD